MASVGLGAGRIAVYLGWTLLLMPAQLLALAAGSRWRDHIPHVYHRVSSRILGFRIVTTGARSRERPTLFVSNHSSYLDIEILGALLEVSFIAKAEVARWPFFGLLARLQRSVFVERRTSKAGEHRDVVRRRLAAGDNLVLFAEGTSSDGNRTLPFKSALFSAAETTVDGRPVAVQPVSVTATALDGMPLGRRLRSLYAWYGDMALMSHLWRMVSAGRVTVHVHFHPVTTLAACGSRKALADHCWRLVAAGVAAANAGRPVPEPPAEPAVATAA